MKRNSKLDKGRRPSHRLKKKAPPIQGQNVDLQRAQEELETLEYFLGKIIPSLSSQATHVRSIPKRLTI